VLLLLLLLPPPPLVPPATMPLPPLPTSLCARREPLLRVGGGGCGGGCTPDAALAPPPPGEGLGPRIQRLTQRRRRQERISASSARGARPGAPNRSKLLEYSQPCASQTRLRSTFMLPAQRQLWLEPTGELARAIGSAMRSGSTATCAPFAHLLQWGG
jgi:hypothetical protein